MLEHKIQVAIMEYLRWNGHIVTRTFVGNVQNAATGSWVCGADIGTPDLITHTKDGRILYCEVKSISGKLSIEQVRWLRNAHKLGLHWVVARSVDDVERALADPSFHGPPEAIRAVLDDSAQFIPTQTKTRGKKTPMSMVTIGEFNRWSGDVKAEKPPLPPCPF